MCKIDNINTWIQARKEEWNSISRISEHKSPVGRKNIDRPRKRWNDSIRIDIIERQQRKTDFSGYIQVY